jgi:maltodextrin utilization protein YvdJ
MATEMIIVIIVVVIVVVIYASKFLYKTRFKEQKVHSD